jgi:hypothetical protein
MDMYCKMLIIMDFRNSWKEVVDKDNIAIANWYQKLANGNQLVTGVN